MSLKMEVPKTSEGRQVKKWLSEKWGACSGNKPVIC